MKETCYHAICATLLLVAGTALVFGDPGDPSVSADAGYPVEGGQATKSGTGFKVDMWGDGVDADGNPADAENDESKTWVDVQGEIANPPGHPADPTVGHGTATDNTIWQGTISNAANPNWEVTFSCKMRATVGTLAHTNGDGTYSADSLARIERECAAMPAGQRLKRALASIGIVAEDTFKTKGAFMGYAPADFPDDHVISSSEAKITISGATLNFKYSLTGNGNISTNRAEMTVYSESQVESDMAVTITAKDGANVIDTFSLS